MVGICFFSPFSHTESELSVIAESEGVFECFGEGERDRIKGISNPSGRALSLGGLIALSRAFDGFSMPERKGRIFRDRFGKPHFDAGASHFSIAHAGRLSVAAISSFGAVGVDIERVDQARDIERIAERFFSASEREVLFAADDPVIEFYRIWTAKEAMMKLGGEGMVSIMSSDSARAKVSGERCFAGYEVSFGKEDYILTLCSENEEKIEMIECEGLRVLCR